MSAKEQVAEVSANDFNKAVDQSGRQKTIVELIADKDALRLEIIKLKAELAEARARAARMATKQHGKTVAEG